MPLQVPVVMARYAGNPDLSSMVEDAVRVHQSHSAALSAAQAFAAILERVVVLNATVKVTHCPFPPLVFNNGTSKSGSQTGTFHALCISSQSMQFLHLLPIHEVECDLECPESRQAWNGASPTNGPQQGLNYCWLN